MLTFVGYYIPGYKAGGPLRTLLNMADSLHESIEFLIITRDRDQDEPESYPSIAVNVWQKVGNAQVYYTTPDKCTIKDMARVVSSTSHDLVYLNSFFDPIFTLKPLLGRLLLRSTDKPVVLAPRGEFSKGALDIKRLKKRVYKFVFSRLYRGLKFQASSEYEKEDFLNKLSWLKRDDVSVAMDLPSPVGAKPSRDSTVASEENSKKGSLRIIFLSRIVRIKNLSYALAVLMNVKESVVFDIYGPKEDPEYWAECETLIARLPSNIKVDYCGNVLPEDVKNKFAAYDLFILPTQGENYGHVIAESISVGTPVLISDQTPWRNLEEEGLGWDFPLEKSQAFSDKIDQLARMGSEERNHFCELVYEKAVEKLTDQVSIDANKELFFSVLKNKEL
ncbi:Glycosyltransferase involved in cell wall bisynthesis [Pseudomonas asplenii]|uniref:Glycosyltransferase involved in cell wall bisynthesis n=1 Tax=Pseudomonas asplenii TaxID=53407 RepID=A0A1H1RH74_9PSED|nr:Glycosyltransferase involved in cell wall bisynthesis [Pseudomonas asplenii]